ncbi:hypothetical protein BN946_scf184764.g3 [Trametes cinnabarina]|uniref:Uncharacterized protein n=1 Tax=Pycnoporus cinnabarinus TaxID=5643 RepID=A0A060SIU5_PYCCI|nr:hypothetical protein BN946_scf184764.g3 [Trametes cinnabarina]
MQQPPSGQDNEDGHRERVSSELIKELSARWQAMSDEEKRVATSDVMDELEERRENKATVKHNVPLAAFQDTRLTLAAVQEELDQLKQRTGTEVFLIAVRSETCSFNHPFVYHTSERIPQLGQDVFGVSLEEFAIRMEAQCIGGMPKVLQNYVMRLNEQKAMVARMIKTKLQHACVRGQISRMFYTNFEENVTYKFGVVLENWPLKKFCAPGEIGSQVELDVLKNAFEQGVTKFRSLSDDEWREWLDVRARAQVSGLLGTTTADVTLSAGVHDTATNPPSDQAPAITSPASAAAASPASAGTLSPTDADPHAIPASGTPAVHEPTSSPPATIQGNKRARQGPRPPPTTNFSNTVTGPDGSMFVLPKPTRRPRSDKGIKRGPRKKMTTIAAELGDDGDATTAATMSASLSTVAGTEPPAKRQKSTAASLRADHHHCQPARISWRPVFIGTSNTVDNDIVSGNTQPPAVTAASSSFSVTFMAPYTVG